MTRKESSVVFISTNLFVSWALEAQFSALPEEVSSFPRSEPFLLMAALCLPPGSLPTNYELYYGFTRFAVELNELDPVLKELLPPTDARFRPDQRSGRQVSVVF